MPIHRNQIFHRFLLHRCPPWFAYFLDNPMRRRLHRPDRMFGPYVERGMRVLDVGVGFGFTTIGLAKLVGPEGKVIAVDAQERMLAKVRARISAEGLQDRVETVCSTAEDLAVSEPVDFVNVFYMLHEVDEPAAFFKAVHACLKPSGRILIAEPKGHVTRSAFEDELALAITEGFEVIDRPTIAISRAAVLSPT